MITETIDILLKKNEERRLQAGHMWIFSNEIDKIEGETEKVCLARLYDNRSNYLGKGFYNKHSLISYRHLTDKDEEIDAGFIFKRLSSANALRKRVNSEGNIYRLCNGEADLLPGLIIDKFENRYSLQIFSAGMDLMIDEIVEVLRNSFSADLIVEKNNIAMRELEGLKLREGILHSSGKDFEGEFIIEIDQIKYCIDLLKGQKSGFYLDQTGNRKLLREYLRKADDVLDLFCNDGGFSLNACMAGAENITSVDSSELCIQRVKKNFELNGYKPPETHAMDCFDFINDLFQTKKRFDVIILDPPSFTKSRKTVPSALRSYKDLNYKCIRLLKPGGLLFTFSCSHHVSETAFEEAISQAGAKTGRNLQLLEKRTCSYDHPVIPQMPETQYFKGLLLRVT